MLSVEYSISNIQQTTHKLETDKTNENRKTIKKRTRSLPKTKSN